MPVRVGRSRIAHRATSIQIIHHQRDFLCILIAPGNILKKFGPVHFGFTLRHLGYPLSRQWFTCHEYVVGTASLVLVILPFRLSGVRQNQRACFVDKLPRCLVHADDRNVRVAFGRKYPAHLPPRLDFVFLVHGELFRGKCCSRIQAPPPDQPASLATIG